MQNHSFILGVHTHLNSLWPAANTLAKIQFTIEFSRNFGQKIDVGTHPLNYDNFNGLCLLVDRTPSQLATLLNIYTAGDKFFISSKVVSTLINVHTVGSSPQDIKAAKQRTRNKVPWAIYSAYLAIDKIAPTKPLKYKIAFALLFMDRLGCRTLRSSRAIKKDDYTAYFNNYLDILDSTSITNLFDYLGVTISEQNKYMLSVAAFEGLKLCVAHHNKHQGAQ